MFLLPLFFVLFPVFIEALPISKEEALEIGNKIWKNECNGSLEKLVFWNPHEACLSLGIGHFIWYPLDADPKFDAVFPKYVAFLKSRGIAVPAIADSTFAPWGSREEFLATSEKVEVLRQWLLETIPLQAEFMVLRLSSSLDAIITSARPEEKTHLKKMMNSLMTTPRGIFALIDYLNFKGDGLLSKERYQGKGWGLYQVLLAMEADGDSLLKFKESARERLKERVRLAPSDETRWLAGWQNRINSY